MQALRIIADEHQSLAAILHAIRFMLKEVSAQRLEPDLNLFQAMVHYLDAYAEKSHHPKEDMLFKYLAKRSSAGAEALAQLALQHAAAPQRIAALETALANFVADPARFGDFAQAFDSYADFYRGHMMIEEDVVLPLVRSHLTDEDWLAVDQEFATDMQEKLTAAGAENFPGLFSRLVECAPAPIGLGPRPYNT